MTLYTEPRIARKPTPASPRESLRRNLPLSSSDPAGRDQGITVPLTGACLDLQECEDPVDRTDLVSSGIGLADHSLLYLNNRLNTIDWTTGVTKHWQQHAAFLIAARSAIPIETAIEIVVARLEASNAEIVPSAVVRQANRAYEYVLQQHVELSHAAIEARKKWKPVFNREALVDLVADIPEVTEEELREKSPVWAETASEYLSYLYPNGEKVAIFDDVMAWKPKWVWEHGVDLGVLKGLGVWYLSNPIDGKWHPNPRNAGKQSMRSEESVTSFRYGVLECDHGKDDPEIDALWLRYLSRLPMPIAAIYTSGNKSIHALVRVDAFDKREWDAHRDQHLRECVTYGADPAALSAVRLTRLPHARNLKTGTMQRLLYLNPQPTGRTIHDCV